jgi:hypothetical protein
MTGCAGGFRSAFDQALDGPRCAGVEVLDDYVLNGLKYATVSTVAWTPSS